MNTIMRNADESDFPAIWEIFHRVVLPGDTVSFTPDTTPEQAKMYWMGQDMHTYVATIDDVIVGTYIIKANFPGLGSHVANGGYMVHPDHQGKGVGTLMTKHSLEEAKRLGFEAIQYNLVVSTNTWAVHLYKKVGFKIVGTLPKAFRHLKLGYIDAYVMHRFLDETL